MTRFFSNCMSHRATSEKACYLAFKWTKSSCPICSHNISWEQIDMAFLCIYWNFFTTCSMDCKVKYPKGTSWKFYYPFWPCLGNFRSLLHSNHKSFPSTQKGTRYPVHLPVETRFYTYLITVYWREGGKPPSRISAMIPKKHWVLLPLHDGDKKKKKNFMEAIWH